ncbi:hypothetical protein [Cytophaga aurantiaca]|nr:hypothetical protein [Cytophaga aurantiaca]
MIIITDKIIVDLPVFIQLAITVVAMASVGFGIRVLSTVTDVY